MSGVMCTWRRPGAADVGLARALVDQALLADLLAEHGRGLALIQAFTHQVCGTYRCGQGKRVWFAVDCDGAELNAAEVRGLVEERAYRQLPGPHDAGELTRMTTGSAARRFRADVARGLQEPNEMRCPGW